MEAGDGTAGDGDEDHGPDGEAGLGVHVGEEVRLRQHFVLAEGQSHEKADGHEEEERAEDGVHATDNGVDGQHGGEEVIKQDDAAPEGDGEIRHEAVEHTGRALGEHDADEQQQHDADEAHGPVGDGAEVTPDEFRQVGSAVLQRHESGEEVVHGSGKDAPEDDPEQRRRAEEGAGQSSEHRAEAGDVEQLDKEDLPGRQRHVVHAVGMRHAGHHLRPGGTVDFFGEAPVKEVPGPEQDRTENKNKQTGHRNARDVTPETSKVQVFFDF